jgi:hypothetical protein
LDHDEGRRIDRMIRQVDMGPLGVRSAPGAWRRPEHTVLAERCRMSARPGCRAVRLSNRWERLVHPTGHSRDPTDAMPLPSPCRKSERPKAAVLGRLGCRRLSAAPLRRRQWPLGGPKSSNHEVGHSLRTISVTESHSRRSRAFPQCRSRMPWREGIRSGAAAFHRLPDMVEIHLPTFRE